MSTGSEALLSIKGKKTTFVAQGEVSECGLACIAMIASRYGYETDLTSLRQRYGTSLKGATLKQIISTCEAIGMNARPLRGELVDLSQLLLPAILHWDYNHFVVLEKISSAFGKAKYIIFDPAIGIRQLQAEEVSRYWTGVALECEPSEKFSVKSDRRELKITQLWSNSEGLWSALWVILALSIVMQAVNLTAPFYLQIAIDTVVPSGDDNLLMMLGLGFGGLAVIHLLSNWMRSSFVVTSSSMLSYQIVINLFRHLLRLPLSYFERRHVGDIISRFGSTQPISQLVSQGMITAVIDGIMAVTTFALMLMYSPLLTASACFAFILFVGCRVALLQSLKRQNLDLIGAQAKENSVFIESIRGIAAIKAFGLEGNRQRIWQTNKANAVNAQIRLGRTQGSFDAWGQFLISAERIIFVYLAVNMAFGGGLTIGMIFAFQAYKQHFLEAGMRLVDQGLNLQVVKVHLSRLADIVMTSQEKIYENGHSEKPNFEMPVVLDRVSFKYGYSDPFVLNNVNLIIPPGEFLAITGKSGGGKTTLMKIIMGLFEPTSGAIRVGDISVNGFAMGAYRRCVGSVAQNDMLYAGSIADNVAFFDPDIDIDRVREVCRLAEIHIEIEMMPMGYHSLVGDMGSVLSGGQVQRILLARALYSDPKILFLDEGTSHLDQENEEKILNMLKALPITVISVAHRPATLAAADRVIRIENGLLIDDEMERRVQAARRKALEFLKSQESNPAVTGFNVKPSS
jgi:ATP-binding cassette subfamily B protein RaxB